MRNLIEQTIEKKLIEDIRKLKEVVLRIRQKQDVGADAIQIAISNLSTADFTIVAGDFVTITTTLTPSDQILSIWNLFSTLEANNTGQPVNHWPDESDDSAHDLGVVIRFEGGLDWAKSNDSIGVRVATFIVENNDNHTLDFTFSNKWYGIRQTI